jgi:phosphatidylserine decarboxylase
MFAVNQEVVPSLGVMVAVAMAVIGLSRLFTRNWTLPILLGVNLVVLGCSYLLYFFRDPERLTPDNPALVFAGADGKVMAVRNVYEDNHFKTNAVRISIFLSLLDVHINRAPISGVVTFADYFPGTRYFTFDEKSSDYNQHSEILIENARTRGLVKQIVGPIARRVVYWLKPGKRLQAGERIGMMKFGSRLDLYLPADDVQEVLVQPGQLVVAGETAVASLKPVAAEVPPKPATPTAQAP